MKNNIVYSICFLLAGILLCSCEKDLSLFPQDKYSEPTFFKVPGNSNCLPISFISLCPVPAQAWMCVRIFWSIGVKIRSVTAVIRRNRIVTSGKVPI